MRSINYSIEVAVNMFKLPLVIKGSGRRVQYVSQIKELFSLNTPSYFNKVMHESPNYHRFKHLARFSNALEYQKIIGGVADIIGVPRNFLMRFIP